MGVNVVEARAAKLDGFPGLRRMFERRRPFDRTQRFLSDRFSCPPELSGIPHPGIRTAATLGRIMEIAEVVVGPEELLVGTYARQPSEGPDRTAEWVGAASHMGGIYGHMAIDYDRLLSMGLAGIREILQRKLERLMREESSLHAEGLEGRIGEVGPERYQREDFLRGGLIAIDGVLRLRDRYVEACRRLLDEVDDSELKANVRVQIGLLERVPEHPARTFHEALQSIYFMFTIFNGVDGVTMALGRLDQVLWPFYERDVAAGRLTRERAIELLGALSIKISELAEVPLSLMSGGVDREGRAAVNELTYLLLEAMDLLRLHNPSVGLAVNEETPEALLERSAEMICSGYCHPALFNDRVIIEGLERFGVKPEDARWHQHCTCTEITTCGSSGIWVVASYMNFGRVFEWIAGRAEGSEGSLCGGLDVGPPGVELLGYGEGGYGRFVPDLGEIGSFERLMEVVKRLLGYVIRENVRVQNQWARSRQVQGAFPLLSLFVNDCIEREADLERGGARYYFFYPQLVGLPTAVDSLVAIKRLVFEERRLGLAEFARIVRENFEGHEELRSLIRNTLPKYGTNDPEADGIAGELAEFYFEEVGRYRNPYGFPYVAGFLSWQMHGVLGSQTGATPDGRLAGQALSDSLASVQGMARRGPTAMLESVEKFDLANAIGAVVVNVTIPVSQRDPKLAAAVKHLIRSHFAKGGFELQFNVVSRETLERAREKPEEHRDLLVRVGGYSDYFVNLSPELQQEIIQRFDIGG